MKELLVAGLLSADTSRASRADLLLASGRFGESALALGLTLTSKDSFALAGKSTLTLFLLRLHDAVHELGRLDGVYGSTVRRGRLAPSDEGAKSRMEVVRCDMT